MGHLVDRAAGPQQGWIELLSGVQPGARLLVPSRVATIREGQRVAVRPESLAGEVWLPPYARETGK